MKPPERRRWKLLAEVVHVNIWRLYEDLDTNELAVGLKFLSNAFKRDGGICVFDPSRPIEMSPAGLTISVISKQTDMRGRVKTRSCYISPPGPLVVALVKEARKRKLDIQVVAKDEAAEMFEIASAAVGLEFKKKK